MFIIINPYLVIGNIDDNIITLCFSALNQINPNDKEKGKAINQQTNNKGEGMFKTFIYRVVTSYHDRSATLFFFLKSSSFFFIGVFRN